jgi:hypothetical protein
MFRNDRTIFVLLASLLVAAMPVLVGAQAPRSALPPIKGPSQLRAAWDGKVQGRQVVTSLAATFEDEEAFRDFAAGRIPFTLTLRSSASGQTLRIPPALLVEGLRPAPGNRAAWVIAIDDIATPLWDSNGCIETSTSAEATDGGTGAAITITYAPCGGPPPAMAAPGQPIPNIIVKGGRGEAQESAPGGPIRCPGDVRCSVLLGVEGPSAQRQVSPIPGIGIVIKKNPGGGAARVVVSGGGSEVGEGDQTARLQLVRSGALVVRASRGEAAAQRQGF